ncbi:MAG: hypothetical protein KBG28_10375 [Kofleriaceae bacterium]|jgi:hypothetical protein|nr:hypothetical protein [Kofleriaceae bacterium]MBP9204360.1 hypothetical protein [Kofleriaceae bacterium]
MGLLDTIKGLFGLNKGNAAPPQMGGHEHQHAEAEASSDDDSGSSGGSDEEHFDTAGFDGDDEETFFNAVLHMESDGEYGGTDESRAEIMARFGIRDRSHWQTVKSSVYTLLIRKHGSMDEVGQREMNWRTGQMQQMMQKRVSGAAASGKLKPVEGVSLEQWAAINASIAGGGNAEDLIKGAGIDQGRWDRASAEWNNRMSTDTTFAVATAYGDAFQKVSKGKYGDYAREAMAARAANRELGMAPPVTLEQFWEITFEQSYGSKQGRDPMEVLKGMGLTVIDWVDLGSFMGYHIMRTGVRNHKELVDTMERVKAKMEAKYPGSSKDVDIQF